MKRMILTFRSFNDSSSHWNLGGLKRVLLKFEMVAIGST